MFFWKKGSLVNQNTGCQYGSTLMSWNESELKVRDEENSFFGFVLDGPSELKYQNSSFTLKSKMYFSVPGDMSIKGGTGIIISRSKYKAFFQIGGPIENTGRLKYIDGCTDSLLISPIVMGGPCLNLLHFPKKVSQTQHTHPSVRAGIVAEGHGVCEYEKDGEVISVDLSPGKIFCIPENERHNFKTLDSEVLIIAYHPDSDFGPTDIDHPMINRTIIGGKSAKHITKALTG